MPNNCAVFGCFSNREKNAGLIFHSFPKDSHTRKKWVHLCKRRDNINVERAQICGLHFEADVYERNLMYELLGKPVPRTHVRMKKGSIPTLHMPTSKHSKKLAKSQNLYCLCIRMEGGDSVYFFPFIAKPSIYPITVNQCK